MLLPLQRMFERFEIDKGDSDHSALFTVLYAGEMATKLTLAALLAGLRDDRDHHRYAHARAVIRADGIGDWATTIDAVLTGPASQFFYDGFRPFQKELTEYCGEESWRFVAVRQLHSCITSLRLEVEALPSRTNLRQWFRLFALLRNKTRGHGAPLASQCSAIVEDLRLSVWSLATQLSLLTCQWAFLYRNLSGKYRVAPLSEHADRFDYLKTAASEAFPNGVYLFSDEPRSVDLLLSDGDVSDFFLPNGQFRDGTFEVLSYITNVRRREKGDQYLVAPSPLPASETEGKPELDVQGNFFGNLPDLSEEYVQRPSLEGDLRDALIKDRHEVISLSGPGGIGKTSLALSVLWNLCRSGVERFAAVIWFSARDIDLLSSGPKPVRPHGLTVDDFAKEFAKLVCPDKLSAKDFRPVNFLAESLSSKSNLGPTVFVFDNFETVSNPAELFRWLDTHVRGPNKILITTRTRDFVGDLPIEVPGMMPDEAHRLIQNVGARNDVLGLLTPAYCQALIDESGGHPYVIKILLGELAVSRQLRKPEKIIAAQDRVLEALFERTYSALTPLAQRVFLLLSNWKSVVPTLGVEAIVMRSVEERVDVRKAIDELRRLSLVEELAASPGDESFLSVPLTAMTFGRKKLASSPSKVVVDTDTELLRAFGAAAKHDVKAGVRPRVLRLIQTIARDVAAGKQTLQQNSSMLEFIASRVPEAWLDIARLYQEQGTTESLDLAKNALRRYLENEMRVQKRGPVWERLAILCRQTGDPEGQLQAWVEMVDCGIAADDISRIADKVNALLAFSKREGRPLFRSEERRTLLEKLIARMERYVTEYDSTDLSRLAWLHLHIGNPARADEIVRQALAEDPENEHCLSLARTRQVR